MGSDLSFLCQHEHMTMQLLEGTSEWKQVALFDCFMCGLHCYRERKLGRLYHGSWTQLAFDSTNAVYETNSSALVVGTQFNICAHQRLSTPHTWGPVNSRSRLREHQTQTPQCAMFYCKDCNMHCICERQCENNLWIFTRKGSSRPCKKKRITTNTKDLIPWPLLQIPLPSGTYCSQEGMLSTKLVDWCDNVITWDISLLESEHCGTHLFSEDGMHCENAECPYQNIPNAICVHTFDLVEMGKKYVGSISDLHARRHFPGACFVNGSACFVHTAKMPIGFYVLLEHTKIYPVTYCKPPCGLVTCLVNMEEIFTFQQTQILQHIKIDAIVNLIKEYACPPLTFLQRNIPSSKRLEDDRIAQKYPRWAVESYQQNNARNLEYILQDNSMFEIFAKHKYGAMVRRYIRFQQNNTTDFKLAISTSIVSTKREINKHIIKYAPELRAPLIRLQ